MCVMTREGGREHGSLGRRRVRGLQAPHLTRGGGGEHLDGDAARPSCASVPAVSPSNERVLQTQTTVALQATLYSTVLEVTKGNWSTSREQSNREWVLFARTRPGWNPQARCFVPHREGGLVAAVARRQCVRVSQCASFRNHPPCSSWIDGYFSSCKDFRIIM